MVIDTLEKFKEFISAKHEEKPTLLLHACCAPCSSYVLELLNEHFDLTIYYYNPNIYPKEEFDIRYEEFQKLGKYKIVKEYYDPSEYYEAIKGYEHLPEGSKRCHNCYDFRLEKSAKYAKENNFDYFTTTLSISPYKNSNVINEIGQKYANEYGVKFLYSNFKKNDGYKKSILLCAQYDIYRQDYCGCEFSLEDLKNKKIAE